MRSVAHEIIHHAQNQRGEFENSFNLGEEGYAQNNSHLRSMEEEAYLSGNMIFRDWEDQFKKQRNQKTMVNENNLRAKIRSMIAEEMANQKAAKKCGADCKCKTCTAKKEKGVKNIAEKIEKEIMPLKEWRNMELNSLLLHRFGLVSPQVLGEKKKMPMKKDVEDADGDGDTDEKVPAFLKKGSAKKTPTKKGKIPPQFLKGKKKDESK
jgi:ferredoxin